MRLDRLAREFAQPADDDDKAIDFSAAGLYIPAAQTITATVVTASTSVLACWLIPASAISAVRTLALTLASGFLVVRKPIKIGTTKGISTIFAALRPCCFIYVLCLVLEQLIHTCILEEATYEHGFWRRVIYHAAMTVMTLGAFLRAGSPRSESDLPFAVSTLALLVIAALPPPALALSGPLCSPSTLVAAAERIVRAFTFSSVYVVLVYSAAPISNHIVDTYICIARSAAASTWVLGSVVYMLPLALLQVGIVLYYSFAPQNLQYEGVVVADMEAREQNMTDIPIAQDEDNKDIVAALSAFKGYSPQTVDSKGLSFNFSGNGVNDAI